MSNPWGQTPSIKKYPLGDIHRILSNSNSYNAYVGEEPEEPVVQQEEDVRTESTRINNISEECENLLRINTEITELNSNFEALELYLKYDQLISDESLKQKIKRIDELNMILSNISKAGIIEKTMEKQEKSAALRNFITVEYEYRKVLIQVLKLIKQNERLLEKGKVLGVRDENDIKDLLSYFYAKGGKVEGICNEVVKKCQDLLENNEKLVNLFNKHDV
mgnify:CR=1 FL=1